MSYQELYQKIVKYLDADTLSWIIMDSFNHQRLATFMERLGITYPGVRTISVSYPQLAGDLAEDALQDSRLAGYLIEKLNDLNQEQISEILQMSKGEIEDYLYQHIREIYLEGKVGKILWALISDSRREINEETSKFIKAIDKVAEEARILRNPLSTPFVSKREYKELTKKFIKIEERIKDESQFVHRVEQENKRLNQRLESYQKRIIELQKDYGQLSQEKGILNKTIQKKDAQIQAFLRQVEELKSKMESDPKRRLKTLLNQLEKENKKLIYDLEKEKRDYTDKVSDLTKQIYNLEQELNSSRQMHQSLQEQLDIERQKVLQLEEERRAVFSPEKSISPKEKGNRIGVFIDAQNVYHSAKLQFNKKLNYRELLERLVGVRHLVKAVCYIVQHPEINYGNFINMLKSNGYTVRLRDLIRRADGSAKGNWDIGMAADIIQMVDKNKLDIVILVTCDGDFADLIKVLKSKGIRTEVAGFPLNTAVYLKRLADDFYSIEKDLMLNDNA